MAYVSRRSVIDDYRGPAERPWPPERSVPKTRPAEFSIRSRIPVYQTHSSRTWIGISRRRAWTGKLIQGGMA